MTIMKSLSSLIPIVILFLNASFTEAVETVKVAAIFAKTGKAALGNVQTLNGIRFAVKELNQQGGVLGKQVELLEFDNKSTAIGSKIAAQKAVKANVVTVIGANWSSNSLAMAPVFQAVKIPMISPPVIRRIPVLSLNKQGIATYLQHSLMVMDGMIPCMKLKAM